MGTSTTSDVLKQVEDVAALAGYNVSRHPNGMGVQIPFDMGNGRSQMVVVVPIGQAGNGKDVVRFYSPCMVVKKGMFKGLSKAQASDLLKRNANMLWGSFGVAELGDSEGVMVLSNQLVETMDVEEFKMHANYVAIVADEYEREHGQDNF
jgi:hypothetical protein